MTTEELQTKLKIYNLRAMSEATGIRYQNLWHIKAGKVKNPTYQNIMKILDYIEEVNK
jgi:DNA-binding Xre family transcriptional regulator